MVISANKPLVIVVENTPNWRDQLFEVLSDEFDLRIFAKAEEAESAIEHLDFECAVLDIRFEDESGFDGDVSGLKLLQIIKNKKPRTGIILLTGYPQDVPEDLIKLCEPDAFLKKGRINVITELRNALRETIDKKLRSSV